MRLTMVMLALLLLVGCSTAGGPQPMPTYSGRPSPTTAPIPTAGEAIDVATRIAEAPEFDRSASLVPVRNVQVERMTLAEAAKRLGTEGLGPGNRPDMPAWLVTIVGEWTYTGSRAADVSGLGPWHTYEIVLSAETGQRIQGRMY